MNDMGLGHQEDMKEKIRRDITNLDPSRFVSLYVLENVPFVFDGSLDSYVDWKLKLSSLIGIDARAILVTGSASVGVSLNPDKNFKAFDTSSDIDVAVVSEHFFQESWWFLRNMGSAVWRLTPAQKNSVDDHRTRLIYWGTVATDRILPILPFAKKWKAALDEMRKHSSTIDREVNVRIFRDFESLAAYQKDGVRKLRQFLLSAKVEEQ